MAVAPLYILIADDYADAIEMYAEYMKWTFPSVIERPVDIVPVLDGASALKQLQQSRFDLVVTDLSMPVMSGETLIRKIRDGETEVGSNSTSRSVPIIVVASLTLLQTEWLRREKDHGVLDAFMDKPCLPEDLAGEVLGVLRDRGLVPNPHGEHSKG